MTRSTHLAVLLGLALVAFVATEAGAMYDPGSGRFLSRDPGAGGPMRVGAAGMATGGHLVERDPYADGMNLYQYVGSNPPVHVDPDGLKKYSYRDLASLIGGCYYPLPVNATDWRAGQLGLITNEVMLCLFWKESGFDTAASSRQDYYGLGQMGPAACDDVDRAYNLPAGTCWRRQQGNDPCDQMSNSIAYLHHVLSNPRDFGHDGTLRGGLRKYGPVDAGFEEYADPILRCADCLKKHESLNEKREPRGVESCSPDKAQACFDTMNTEVREARERRRQ